MGMWDLGSAVLSETGGVAMGREAVFDPGIPSDALAFCNPGTTT